MGATRHLALARLVVRLSAPLVPRGLRDDWRREWEAELASLADLPCRHRRPVRRALGALVDAFWLRQRGLADFDWIDDLRHGLRQLARQRSFAATAIGILGLGLAATVTMFSVTSQILLRPLPYPDADRIVAVYETRVAEHELLDPAPGNYLDWRGRSTSFEHLVGVVPWSMDVAGDPRPEVWRAAQVTPGFFEIFGLPPLVGRYFTDDDYTRGSNGVVVIGEAFWRRRFAADPSVIGRSFRVDDGSITIVGVAPAALEPRLLGTGAALRQVWAPKAIEEYEPRIRGTGYWAVVGRLKPDVTLERAQAELTAVSLQLAKEYPQTNDQTGARVMPIREHLVGNVRLAVILLAGAVALVLVIACVNVANLLLARGASREREMAVRVALGAQRARLMQQLLLESLVIACVGGLVGAVLASWALAALARLGPASVPWIDTLHLDWRAVVFTVLMSVAVAVLSGILPAWRVARSGLAVAGRNTSTPDAGQHRLRAALVIAEVAVALVLVTGAGLLIRSFIGLMSVDPGFARDRVLAVQVFAWDYSPGPDRLRAFFDASLERLAALPAVQSVGAVSAMPFIESNINIQGSLMIGGRPAPPDTETPRAHFSVATPGYFEAMRIPLKSGRYLSRSDGPRSKRVAVITDTMARRYWPEGDDPIGDTLRLQFAGTPLEVEVVGVIASLRHDSLDRAARDELFMPHAQVPYGSMTFVVRSAGDATTLVEPARQAIWSINPQQTIYRSATLDELVQNTVSPRRFALLVMIAFAAVALLLAIAGVYSVLSAVMTSRVREVGLRVALGASRADIVRLVLTRGVAMALVGLALGLVASLGAAQLLRSFLFQVTPADPMTLVAAAGLMTLAAAAACYMPARRAAAADPVTVLRTE